MTTTEPERVTLLWGKLYGWYRKDDGKLALRREELTEEDQVLLKDSHGYLRVVNRAELAELQELERELAAEEAARG